MDATRPAIGRFMVLEGPDGAGKSRAAADLVDRLRAAGRTVTAVREPGGTRLGELVRELVLDTGPIGRGPEADALLFNAARGQLVRDVIRPALDRGEIVVSDRFAPSTLAYQGYGSGLELRALRAMEAFATGGLTPDLVLLLDVPGEVGLARRSSGDPSEVTRFEDPRRHDRAYHERVRSGYLAMAAADPVHWRVIDADRDPGSVADDVVAEVMALVGVEPLAGSVRRLG